MSELKRVPATLLSCRTLPHADARLCEALGLPAGAAGELMMAVTAKRVADSHPLTVCEAK